MHRASSAQVCAVLLGKVLQKWEMDLVNNSPCILKQTLAGKRSINISVITCCLQHKEV